MNKSLCFTCTISHIMHFSEFNYDVYCTEIYNKTVPIHQPVIKCNSYREKNQVHKDDYEKIAWIIRSDKKGKLGFNPPTKEQEEGK